VIEGHGTVKVNDEIWLKSVTGVVARTAIGPDRVVRSYVNVVLRIEKRVMGFIRDSYKRGWLHLWYDHWKPF
jgi:hypothetical protein